MSPTKRRLLSSTGLLTVSLARPKLKTGRVWRVSGFTPSGFDYEDIEESEAAGVLGVKQFMYVSKIERLRG